LNFVSKFDGSIALSGHHPKAQTHVDTVSTKAPADAIIVKDAQLLFGGDFKRSGSDLVISKGDHELRLEDYFRGDKHAPLASPDGAYLTGNIVDALTGHVQMAQADGSASAAKIIGHVTKLTGNATVVRNGVSIILNNGDNVHQGDVVQSGSNSTLGITFIDGSVFGLASNAKMVLNEMVYDPNGSSNSSLLSLVSGTISFVAGATAKHGDMKVDTPVATMGIRGTAVLVEIEFDVLQQNLPLPPQIPPLSPPDPLGVQLAPPVRFQVLIEPDGTSGSYVLLERTTLAPMATVSQPGTVTTVSGNGAVSFLASAQLSPEAMRLINEVFSQRYTDNANPRSDTHFTDTVIPDNTFAFRLASGDPGLGLIHLVVVPDSTSSSSPPPPGTNGHIPGAPGVAAFGAALSERLHLTGSSLIDTVSNGISYADVNVGDSPSASATFAHFTYSNAQGAVASLTPTQLAAISAVSVPLVITQDPAGRNTGVATWTYNVADHAFDFLAAGETLTLTYIARVDNNFAPNNEAGFATFTITVTGTNDTPTIVVNQTAPTGAVVEDSNVNASGNITAGGAITFNDVDLTDTHTAALTFSSSHASASLPGFADNTSIGTFALVPVSEVPADGDTTGSVGWTFTLDDSNPILQSLAEGQTITLVYIVTLSDGHGGTVDQEVTITITGSNDSPNHAPTIVGELTTATGAVTEDVDVNAAHQIAADGTITFRDLDLIDTHTASFVQTSSTSNLPGFTNNTDYIGTFALNPVSEDNTDTINTASVGWTFTLDDSNHILQSLAEGETITQVYTVTISDNHGGTVTQDVTVTITGTNDAPEVTTTDNAFFERSNDNQPNPTGSTADDTVTGTISFTDVDLIDAHEVTIQGVVASGITTGAPSNATMLGWLSLGALTDATNGVTGSTGWTFTAQDQNFDYLAVGERLVLTYTIRVDDHQGGVVDRPVTVTVTGTNDTPAITSSAPTPSFDELTDTYDSSSPHATSGAVTFTDVDLSDTHNVTISGFSATGTTAGLDAGAAGWLTLGSHSDSNGGATGSQAWSFSAQDHYFDYLAVGEHVTLTYTIQVDDHHGGVTSQDVTVTVNGSNDAPVISAATDDSFSELSHDPPPNPTGSSVPDTASGTISFTDLDLSDRPTVSATFASYSYTDASPSHHALALTSLQACAVETTLTVTQVGGNTNNGSATWDYSAPDSAFDFLGADETLVLTYVASVYDGHTAVTAPITVTVTGTNDTPTITSSAATQSFDELDTHDSSSPHEASGAVTFTDVDYTDTHNATINGFSATGTTTGLDAGAGSWLTLGAFLDSNGGATGSQAWSFSAADHYFDYLAVGEHVTLTYTIQVDDDHGGTTAQDVTITVDGSNDAPVITAASDDSFNELSHDPPPNPTGSSVPDTASGTISFTDLDLSDRPTVSATFTSYAYTDASHQVHTLTADQEAAIEAVLAVTQAGGNANNGSAGWSYSVPDSAFDFLGEGDTLILTYTASVYDGHTTVTTPFTITVTGTNDAAVISGTATATLTETNAAQSTGGTLVATDPDSSNLFTVQTNAAGSNGYSTFSINAAGVWTNTMNNAHNEFVGGTDYTDSITVATADGTQQQLTVTIHGSNESAPPVVDLNEDTTGLNNVVNHSPNSVSPIPIAHEPTITDVDSPNLVSMTITLTNPLDNSSGSGGINVREILSLTDEAAALATHDGLTVSLSNPANLNDPITLTITGSASLADYQAILAGVQYVDTKSGHQDATDRIISVVVNDGTQDSAVQTVTVTSSHIINGTAAADTLVSTSGNDYITGGAGADSFTFSSNLGHDTIADFTPGTDIITFSSALFTNATAVLGATHDDGQGNTVITVDSHDSITLNHVLQSQLAAHQSDFHFV
jgi:VCBS repeat-containing protein